MRVTRRLLLDVDVLHTMAFSSIFVALPIWSFRRLPWVHTEHWNGVTNPRSQGALWPVIATLRWALRFPHVVCGVTEELAAAMAKFARPNATRVIPCVVQPPLRVNPFPPAEPWRLIAVGLLIQRKNPLLALEVIGILHSRGCFAHYTWVGDGPLRAAFERRVLDLGLEHHVTLVGAVPPQSVPDYLAAAHMFFLPSARENFFTAVAESIVAGRPAVAPRSGGFDSYCAPTNSVLVDSWRPEELADALIKARAVFAEVEPDQVASTLADRFSLKTIGASFAEAQNDATRHIER